MGIVFADTGYWVALLNPRDDLHNKALTLSMSLNSTRIFTTEMVLTEVLNDFSKRGDYLRNAATRLIPQLRQDPNTTIIGHTSDQFEAALNLYGERQDQEWSLTDCLSFLIMEELDIKEALAYDKHFTQARFVPLMRNCQLIPNDRPTPKKRKRNKSK